MSIFYYGFMMYIRTFPVIILIGAFLNVGCASTKPDYTKADWYKSSKRKYQLDENTDSILTERTHRQLALEELTQTAGVRRAVVKCPIRLAPVDGAGILRHTKFGERLWTQDNGGEWFRVNRKKGHAFVHKSCFRG